MHCRHFRAGIPSFTSQGERGIDRQGHTCDERHCDGHHGGLQACPLLSLQSSSDDKLHAHCPQRSSRRWIGWSRSNDQLTINLGSILPCPALSSAYIPAFSRVQRSTDTKVRTKIGRAHV